MTRPARRASLVQILMQRIKGPQKVDLPVSVYGKLPFYKDFLRHALAGTECQAFKRWLDQGISQHWASSEARRDHKIGGHSLFVTFPATRRRLLVYLWGSSDTDGLRSFPFAIFVSLPKDRKATPLSHLDALGQVRRQAQELRYKLEQTHRVDQFQPLIRTTSLHLRLEEPASPLEWFGEDHSPTVGQFAESLYPEEGGRRLRVLLRILRRLRGRGGVALRLPLSDRLPPERQAALWTLMLEKNGTQTAPLQVLFGTETRRAGLTLIRRDLRSDDTFALHPDLFDYEYITDLREDLPSVDEVPDLTESESAASLDRLLEADW